jgi:beta-1,2-mannobiose phosphorylase / 1,2-beta-oligomannan phosphorylase
MEMTSTVPWHVRRLGIVMEPHPTDPWETCGVLNPAVARGSDGQLYMLPRLVAAGNYSRIGLTRVLFNRRGMPTGVERLGIALEPQAPYELNTRTGGGVEDPRITYIAARRLYVMTYTAYGESGPRIAAATSRDLTHWRRAGLVRFAPLHGLDLAMHDNKDAVLFPAPTTAPDGREALALIHRPTFATPYPQLHEHRPSMWISYAPLSEISAGKHVVFGQHHLLATPQQGWEHLKVGAGAPPLRIEHGWLLLYHGVSARVGGMADRRPRVRYCVGALLLDALDPRRILYRSARSILTPQAMAERVGEVPHVVFPTGLDMSPDGMLDIYYGMADRRIGVARTRVTHLVASVQREAA